MGEVFRAHDPVLGRDVAIKILAEKLSGDDTARQRFQREARSAAQLNHPNIITVHDFGEEQGMAYMAMELLEGADLRELIEQHRVGGLEDRLVIMEQILEGLAFAHSRGVFHRDLKPGNIHVLPNGQVKIMDFGLARRAQDAAVTGVVMGTPYYIAPEQAEGGAPDGAHRYLLRGGALLRAAHRPPALHRPDDRGGPLRGRAPRPGAPHEHRAGAARRARAVRDARPRQGPRRSVRGRGGDAAGPAHRRRGRRDPADTQPGGGAGRGRCAGARDRPAPLGATRHAPRAAGGARRHRGLSRGPRAAAHGHRVGVGLHERPRSRARPPRSGTGRGASRPSIRACCRSSSCSSTPCTSSA